MGDVAKGCRRVVRVGVGEEVGLTPTGKNCPAPPNAGAVELEAHLRRGGGGEGGSRGVRVQGLGFRMGVRGRVREEGSAMLVAQHAG